MTEKIFFLNHKGIFGNTGSGKSNTFNKIYYNFIKLIEDKIKKLNNTIKILIFDYYDEYGYSNLTKQNSKLEELNINNYYIPLKKLGVKELTILFSASDKTQIPLLDSALKLSFTEENSDKYNKNILFNLKEQYSNLYGTEFNSNKNIILNLLNYIDSSFLYEHLKKIRPILKKWFPKTKMNVVQK